MSWFSCAWCNNSVSSEQEAVFAETNRMDLEEVGGGSKQSPSTQGSQQGETPEIVPEPETRKGKVTFRGEVVEEYEETPAKRTSLTDRKPTGFLRAEDIPPYDDDDDDEEPEAARGGKIQRKSTGYVRST
mmetsp:Transcript_101290/g.179997  ORF Transcript_101290/g.179997 Transcript_101290/m.179997 type:complete len:130 (-) Transcript_101290:76-465(-)|eukprot:CAMPEP_0197658362 /NCGR_PEP_ID=MMETSP1338-20131121/45196_1 /TAXON_ID=43686 ORGANISM="Pelagodinium beii, Strain RCC1491" /NCGR_SAMPLE_ID=MMETSP1338 /ASSEMBLY_ACC=CAM_ASM_000754 /LENGTH=129 /DNA_ID=CAMNT_0043234939 /DNA_START=119 /DNA_END=508 /DNA_ORIENTATION=-